MAPLLTIRLTKHADGGATLTCLRADGTLTWQRQRGGTATFFPRHDLTHYAVETVLGFRRGFYGLVASGWDLGDFGAPWPRGPLPVDMEPAELLVGFLDAERAGRMAGGGELTASELTAQAAAWHDSQRRPGSPTISDEQLAEMRTTMRALFARWDTLAADGVLELAFEP